MVIFSDNTETKCASVSSDFMALYKCCYMVMLYAVIIIIIKVRHPQSKVTMQLVRHCAAMSAIADALFVLVPLSYVRLLYVCCG